MTTPTPQPNLSYAPRPPYGKAVALALGVIASAGVLGACTSAADKANRNIDTAADNFEVPRRITAINGITDKVLFSVEGFCSVKKADGDFSVTCKQPDGNLTRTTMILSDNVTATVTQIGGTKVSLFRTRVLLRPTFLPNFDLSTPANP